MCLEIKYCNIRVRQHNLLTYTYVIIFDFGLNCCFEKCLEVVCIRV